jgi:hypothetical protein
LRASRERFARGHRFKIFLLNNILWLTARVRVEVVTTSLLLKTTTGVSRLLAVLEQMTCLLAAAVKVIHSLLELFCRIPIAKPPF